MKNKYVIISQLFLIGVILVIFSGCEKENIKNEDEQIEQPKTGYSIIDGYLKFESISSFLETTDAISNFSNEERKQWETGIGFVSQRRIVDNVIEQEIILDSINEDKYSRNEHITDAEFHSDAYTKAIEDGIIKIMDENTDDEYWDYAVFNRGFIEFINKDGLFAIGDTLYQVTQGGLKVMKSTNVNDPETLLSASKSDKNKNILFLNMESDLNLKAASPGLIESDWVRSGGGKKGEKRIKIGIYLDVRLYVESSTSPQFHFYHEVYVQCQERNWLRKWKYKFTDVTVNGSWDISVFRYPQSYLNSWSYSGNVSYLKACINPETGSTAPYQSYFQVSAQNINQNYPSPVLYQYNYPPVFDSYNWSASRGGLTASLNK